MLSDDLAITWQIFGDFGNYLAKQKVGRQWGRKQLKGLIKGSQTAQTSRSRCEYKGYICGFIYKTS